MLCATRRPCLGICSAQVTGERARGGATGCAVAGLRRCPPRPRPRGRRQCDRAPRLPKMEPSCSRKYRAHASMASWRAPLGFHRSLHGHIPSCARHQCLTPRASPSAAPRLALPVPDPRHRLKAPVDLLHRATCGGARPPVRSPERGSSGLSGRKGGAPERQCDSLGGRQRLWRCACAEPLVGEGALKMPTGICASSYPSEEAGMKDPEPVWRSVCVSASKLGERTFLKDPGPAWPSSARPAHGIPQPAPSPLQHQCSSPSAERPCSAEFPASHLGQAARDPSIRQLFGSRADPQEAPQASTPTPRSPAPTCRMERLAEAFFDNLTGCRPSSFSSRSASTWRAQTKGVRRGARHCMGRLAGASGYADDVAMRDQACVRLSR